ncbi:MAG: DUF2341 domain-containing protein [Kofleriaceae bacterium]
MHVVGALVALSLVASCKSLLGIDDGVVANPQDAGADAVGDALDDASDGPPDASLGWWDPTFLYRRAITINTSALTLPLANLPVLVRLPSAVVTELAANGADARFVADDHVTALPFEIDTSVSNSAHAWVKLSLTTANPRIWLYYGKSAATSASSGAMVFDDYESVHHLTDNADASGNGHGGAVQAGATIPAIIDGIIGRAHMFDGNNDYIALSNGDDPFDFTTTMSVSAWCRTTGFTVDWQTIVAKGLTSWRVHRDQNEDHLAFGTGAGTLADNVPSSTEIRDGAWHHVFVAHDAVSRRIYIDGVLEGQGLLFTPTIPTNGSVVRIGANDQVDRPWAGAIDEVRISATTRSAAWVRAEYVMVTSPTFTTFGPRETSP